MPPGPPPARAITRGPKFHWFGYYDKLQFDPSGRCVLGMEVGFEHRPPGPDDLIKVGLVDLAAGCAWIELGESRAWCWQQGCMLQWRPGSAGEVLWNDRQGDRFVCHVLDTTTGRRRTLPHPIYCVSPDGRTALGLDFRRLNHLRPGYGYAGPADPNENVSIPDDSGIYRMDLETGEARLILSIAEVARQDGTLASAAHEMHWVNHLLFSPDGARFVFLHRWRPRGEALFRRTHMLTAAPDGSDLRLVDDSGFTSHFIWRDARHILAWARRPPRGGGFNLFEDGARAVEPVGEGVMTEDGHCSYLPGGEWILCDTYPRGGAQQQLYLYHAASGRRVEVGAFDSPPAYRGPERCDLHPRHGPDGRRVVIDSPHGGDGRQMYLLDVGDLVG